MTRDAAGGPTEHVNGAPPRRAPPRQRRQPGAVDDGGDGPPRGQPEPPRPGLIRSHWVAGERRLLPRGARTPWRPRPPGRRRSARREPEREQRRVLARVVGALGGRVHPVVGAEDHHVLPAQQRLPTGQRRVHSLQARGEAVHIVAVAPDGVEVHEVGEQQAVFHLAQVARARGDAGGVVGGVVVDVDPALHEDLADLADAHDRHAALLEQVQVGRSRPAPARSRAAATCGRSSPRPRRRGGR